MLIRTLILLLIAFPAFAAGPNFMYLVGTGATPCAQSHARERQICAALGCDGGGMVASISGTSLIVTAVGGGGPLVTGTPIAGVGVGSRVRISAGQSQGATVATGTYPITNPANVTVASEGMVYGFTYEWHPVKVLLSGVCAIEIHVSDAYYDKAIAIANGATTSLTAGEQSALVTRASLAGQLPEVIVGSVFLAEFSTAQQTAMDTFASTHPSFSTVWTAVKSATAVDLNDTVIQVWMNAVVAAGLIPASQQTTMMTPAVATAGP